MLSTLITLSLRAMNHLDAMRRLLMLVVIAALGSSGRAEPQSDARPFDIAAGYAATTLRRFAEQSGEQVLFVVRSVRDIETRAVRGHYSAREAIDRMLVGTDLSVVEDAESGAFMIYRATKTVQVGDPGNGTSSKEPSTRENPKTMKRKNPISALAAAIAMAFGPAHAQSPGDDPAVTSASIQESGIIEGRVYNAASGAFLTNARVSVEGTSLEAFTDSSGTYRLRNVPAGPVQVRVRFTGQKEIVDTVNVSAGTAVRANFTFNADTSTADPGEVILNEYVVNESRFRNAMELATNEERTTVNIKSVVALDSLGYVPDGNVGDFVRFLPGVDISYGGGTNANPDNATAVAVRGFGADSTAVLIDGVPVASGSPGGLTRTVQLDSLSINNASRLEIIKVATPDMPQDSPGGAINLITRGAFELPRATYDVSVAFNANSNDLELFRKSRGPNSKKIYKTQPSVRFAGSIPITEKLGVSFSLASDNKYSLTRYSNMRDWFMFERNTTASGVAEPVANANGGIRIDNPVIDRLELKEYQWLENRLSGSLRMDWRPFDGLEVRVSGNFNTFENLGSTYRTQWRYRDAVGIADWGSDYVTGFQRTPTFNPRVSGDMTVDARDKEGFTTQGTLSLRYNRGGWAILAQATASESYHSYPDRDNGHFSTVDATISPGRMDLTGIRKGVVGEILLWDVDGNPLDYGTLDNWNQFTDTGGVARSSEVYNRDIQKQYNLDVARDLDFLPFPATLKVGGLIKEKSNHRWGRGETYRMHYVGPAIPNTELQSDYATDAVLGYGSRQYWADPGKIYRVYRDNPEYFDDEFVSAEYNVDNRAWNYASRVGNRKGLTIKDSDWYGMLTAKFFDNRVTVITGARQSRKDQQGYNVFNDPQYMYVKMPDGTVYRDSVYPGGVRYDNDSRDANRNAVITDLALRERMRTAGVAYLPDRLETSPDGGQGNRENNLHFAPLGRYTREIDTSLTQPWMPQVQVAYDVSDSLRLQMAWSKETRLPDLEGSNGLIVNGANFEVNQASPPTDDLGGEGTIRIANVNGEPEINESYNFKIAYYPKNGLGRYTVSYYYKTVDNAWTTTSIYNTDQGYDELLASMGLSRSSYENYRIDTVLTEGDKQIRKGFEIEINQNMSIIGPWGRSWDMFVTYTRRPVTTQSGVTNRLGWIPRVPVRAKWSAGLSYSAKRFSAQARMNWVESGINYRGGNTSVDLPDGTRANVQFYDLNEFPPEIKLEANYMLSERFTVFAVADKVLTKETYRRTSDSKTGYMPAYASYREYMSRGISFTAGLRARF